MPLLPFTLATVLSFIICNWFTHPKSFIWNKLPKVRGKRVEFFPSIRIKIKGKVIHFHHWFNYSILLGVSVFITSSFLDSAITRGFLLGGVLQGLSVPSARKLIYKESWLRKMLK